MIVRRALTGLALAAAWLPVAHAHDGETHSAAPAEPEVAIPGSGAPAFKPPAAGSYALPPLGEAVGGEVLTSDGTPADLGDFLGDKLCLLSFIYAARAVVIIVFADTMVALLAGLITLPHFLSFHHQDLMIFLVVNVLVVVSYRLVTLTGEWSLIHIVMMGVGAYAGGALSASCR